jgi:hypothetical protein
MRSTIVGSVLAVSTHTQAQDYRFLGLTETAIIVEELEEEDAACGVTGSGIDAAIRLPLDASRLEINPTSLDFVYANVGVMHLNSGLCVASVQLSMTRALRSPVNTLMLVTGSVWHKGTLLTGPSYDFGTRVHSQIEDDTKQLIAEWLKANPR